MSTRTRTVALLGATCAIVASAAYLVSLLTRGESIAVDRAWKCTKCGHVFEKEFEPDPWAITNVGPDGKPRLEVQPCPKCGGPAHVYAAMVCSKCGHVFQHLEAMDPATREPKLPTCPKCQSTQVRPRAPTETAKP
jgi:NAD-dependent SIR2 family protein deacetylase